MVDPLSSRATQPGSYISKPEGQGAIKHITKRITLLFAADVDDYIAHQTPRAASFYHSCVMLYSNES